jgi:hypothetical protein
VESAAKVLSNLQFDFDGKFAVIHANDTVPVEDLIPILDAMRKNDIVLWCIQIGGNPPTGMNIWNTNKMPARTQSTRVYRRISVAEVGTVRLEVEQFTNQQNGIYIRVNDYAANNHQKTNIVCDLYWIDENGKEAKTKFLSVTLKQTASNSDNYSGDVAGRTEFEHGNKFKVVYKSVGLPFPISTWYACYYH